MYWPRAWTPEPSCPCLSPALRPSASYSAPLCLSFLLCQTAAVLQVHSPLAIIPKSKKHFRCPLGSTEWKRLWGWHAALQPCLKSHRFSVPGRTGPEGHLISSAPRVEALTGGKGLVSAWPRAEACWHHCKSLLLSSPLLTSLMPRTGSVNGQLFLLSPVSMLILARAVGTGV